MPPGTVAPKEKLPEPLTRPEPSEAFGVLSSVALTVSPGTPLPDSVTEPPAATEVGLTASVVAV